MVQRVVVGKHSFWNKLLKCRREDAGMEWILDLLNGLESDASLPASNDVQR